MAEGIMKDEKQWEKMKIVKFEFCLKFIYVFCSCSAILNKKYKLEMKREMESAKNFVIIVSRIYSCKCMSKTNAPNYFKNLERH